MKEYFIYFITIGPVVYFITIVVFDLLLRGFAPFLPSRPWVVEALLREITIKKENPKFVAFSTGRSGFFHALEKKYPNAELVAVEPSFFPFIISKAQGFIRRTKMKVVYQEIHRVYVKDADLIYSHLNPDGIRQVDSKFKFECKPGALVISTGFNMPALKAKKEVSLEDRKGRLDFLSKNQKLFQRSGQKFKKEKKAYFYEI